MILKTIIAIFLISLTPPIQAANSSVTSDTAYSFPSTEDAARFDALTRQIRCVVCQHQNIAESSTPIADSMRRKVYQLILDKKSDSEIKAYLVKRYGEYILLNPRFSARTIVLWMFPFLALLIAAVVLFLLFRKKK